MVMLQLFWIIISKTFWTCGFSLHSHVSVCVCVRERECLWTKCTCTVYKILSFMPYISPWLMIFSCDQAALRLAISVCPSVSDTFFTMFLSSYHHEIFRSNYQWQKWCPGQRSRSEVKDQSHRGQNPTQRFPGCNSSLNSYLMIKLFKKLNVA